MNVVAITPAERVLSAGAVLPGAPADAPSTPGHVSFTQLACFADCPEQYRQRYVLRRPYVRSAPLVVGVAVHGAIATVLGEQARTGVRGGAADWDDALLEAWDVAVAEGDVEWGGEAAGKLVDQAGALVRAYAADVAPSVDPVAVEVDVTTRLPGTQKLLVGRVDVVEQGRIRETKTTSATQSAPMAGWVLQARLYQAALYRPVVWDQLVKTKVPKAVTGLEVAFSAAASRSAVAIASVVARQVDEMMVRFGADEAWPMLGASHPWACSRCSARAACAWGAAS